MSQSICIIGGGAAGVGLAWLLARAQQLGHYAEEVSIKLLHNEPSLGGHSTSYPVTCNGKQYNIDLGVQMIAPKMYPNIMTQLALPDLKEVTLQPVDLRIAATFPPDGGTTPYWGNFAGYQDTPLWKTGVADCKTFEGLMKVALVEPWHYKDSLETFLDKNASRFQDLDNFKTYFLDAYMEIMNGYGNARLDQTSVVDLAPIFDFGLGSFTNEVEGYARFTDGSGAWIQHLSDLAAAQLGKANYEVIKNATAKEVYPADSGATVVWEVDGKDAPPQTFDIVVSTIDMMGNATILDNATNQASGLWDFYEPYVGKIDEHGQYQGWPLMAGACYLHQDASILAPGTPQPPQETLQFTAYWATQEKPYSEYSFATFVEKNLMQVDDPDFEYYVTMYGYDPQQKRDQGIEVRVPKDPIVGPIWVHGMWLPTFMTEQKEAFANAQGVSPHRTPHPNQRDTNIYFAGNNLTMDSEEGAFVSSMALLKYVFDIDAPLCVASGINAESMFGAAEYLFFFGLMFDKGDKGDTGAGDHKSSYQRLMRYLKELGHFTA